MELFCKLCLQPVLLSDWKSHTSQKQHLQQLPSKIVVKGSFNQEQVEEVYTYFAQFGGIRGQSVAVHVDDVEIEYRFWDPRIYSEIIHQEHRLFDEELEISWYKKVKSGPIERIFQDEKMYKEKYLYRKIAIINSIKEASTFADEINIFQNKLRLVNAEMEKVRTNVKNDLNTTLAKDFPNSKMHFFGSTVTELNIHDSNLNIYIDNTNSELTTLELLKNIITSSDYFVNVSLSSQSHVPIIKCDHKKTKVSCELNIRNELPVGNSELIKFYLTLDKKLPDLMLLLKFWADCYNLRHEEGFSSYAFCLMVIFYLQQEPYNLPSVVDLQKDMFPDEIDGWNCAFGPIEFSSPSLENATLRDLVENFFEFYGQFDYTYKVISPYMGSEIEKTKFLRLRDLPECFETYINQDRVLAVNSGICIQDPFELANNVSALVPFSCAGKFMAVCRNSLQLVRSSQEHLLYTLLLNQVGASNEFCLIMEDTWNNQDWITGIKDAVLKILKEICGCNVKELCEPNIYIYLCKGQHNIWDSRVQVLKDLQAQSFSKINEMDTINKEILVTSRILTNFTQNINWEMEVALQFDMEPCRVNITFKKEQGLPCVLHIAHIFYIVLAEFLSNNSSPIQSVTVKNMETFMEIDEVAIDTDNYAMQEMSALKSVDAEANEVTQILGGSNLDHPETFGNGDAKERTKSNQEVLKSNTEVATCEVNATCWSSDKPKIDQPASGKCQPKQV